MVKYDETSRHSLSLQNTNYISTGLKENKFGVDMSDALNLYQQAQNSKYLKPIHLKLPG
jgi:diaminopimelate decarboxylase